MEFQEVDYHSKVLVTDNAKRVGYLEYDQNERCWVLVGQADFIKGERIPFVDDLDETERQIFFRYCEEE